MNGNASVCNGIDRRTHGDPTAKIKGLVVYVDLRLYFVDRIGGFFGNFGDIVRNNAHGNAVFFFVIRAERFMRGKNLFQLGFDLFKTCAVNKKSDVQVIGDGIFVKLLLKIHSALRGCQRINAVRIFSGITAVHFCHPFLWFS